MKKLKKTDNNESELFRQLEEQYREELRRLSYSSATINAYERVIRKLYWLMKTNGISVDELTPALAVELVLRPGWEGVQQRYAKFIVRRFTSFLREKGYAKPALPPTEEENTRSALLSDYE
jgi:hypothetical protein